MAAKEINKDKLKALQLTLDKIEKNFGKGSIMKLGDNEVEDIPGHTFRFDCPGQSAGGRRLPERTCN